jgi:signal transduction histidine kinase
MRYWAIIGVGAFLALSMSLISTVLTGRTEVRPLPFAHEPLEEKGGAVQRELDRLYTRYDDRLASLSGLLITARPTSLAAESAASKIAGVRTATRISLSDSGEDLHLEIRRTGEGEVPFDPGRFPRPVLTEVSSGSGLPDAKVRKIDATLMQEKTGSSGWLRNGDSTLYRWTKPRAHLLILIGIDTLSVAKLTDRWLSENPDISGGFASVLEKSGAASARLLGPDGTIIEQAGSDVPFGANSARFPASIRFGTWLMEGVGKSTTVRIRNWPWFFAGQGIALVLLVASVLAATALRRADHIAAQRVSFVNRASHELRTPITNMMLNVDLAEEMLEEDPAAARERLGRVSGEASRLSRLVDNLLTFSRSENGTDRLHLSPLDPLVTLEEVLSQFDMSMKDRGIEVVWKGRVSAEVSADHDALAQVFGNLISNVEKYAASGKRLEIDTQQIAGRWRVEFHDHGPGISARQAPRIFDPFHRVRDQVNEGVSGTGLGLTIARDLARRMGGELELVRSDQGATFRLELSLVTNE